MRFAVIGCGMIAQVIHIPYLAELPDAKLHAFVDPAEKRAASLEDADRMVEADAASDAVAIVTQ